MADARWPRGGAGAAPPGPIVLDAAMGTRLIARGLDLSDDDPCLWAVDRPEEVARVHRLDVLAGADAVTTNTFGANRRWLSRFGREGEVAAINQAAVAIAREAAGLDRLVLGCIGPTAIDPAQEFDSLAQQARALGRSGVDAVILETLSADAPLVDAVAVVAEAARVPIILSFALVSDDDPMPALGAPMPASLVAVGWNCITPGRAVTLPGTRRAPIGLPLVLQPSGPWEPEPGTIARLIDQGVRLFGGCCGTTEREVAALRAALDGLG